MYNNIGRARRGVSGALYPQTATAGLNSHPRCSLVRLAPLSGVESRVLRGGAL